ncbi:MAG: CPBP family intramembrane metalloprotease [Burkholderiaceae bacterium]|nr:CPBP family intramembrane metalloprotease [Burkholderiaceae bacterium]
MAKSTLSLSEAAVVTVICFGLPILWSVQAMLAGFPQARFSDASNIWLIILELILAGAALLFLRSRNFAIQSLYPGPTVRGSLLGVGLFLTCWLLGAVVTALFYSPERPGVIDFSFSGVSLTTIVLVALVNGTFEEVFLLGVLVRGLRGLGLSLAIGLPLLVRVLYHLYQGPVGVVWILSFGLTLTLAYVITRQLWPCVLAHTLWDIVPAL